ncbi:LPP protein, partial [Locustella ochotensis]|nr:LPP protein [Locustella ochotensis]
MSHPSWLPPKSTNEPLGHVTARMETTHTFGTPSISVSTQQTPKKFAPVVAPKPKYNPYKQPGGDGDFLPPPPPPVDDLGNITSSQGAFPPPPPLDDVTYNVQVNPGGKTLEERRSSLDAEIDSLTSILADLESSSPYKPRTQQVSGTLCKHRVGKGPASTSGVNLLRLWNWMDVQVLSNPNTSMTNATSAHLPWLEVLFLASPLSLLRLKSLLSSSPISHSCPFSLPNHSSFNHDPLTFSRKLFVPCKRNIDFYITWPMRHQKSHFFSPPQPHGPGYGYGPQPGRPAEPAYGYAPPQGRYQDPYYGGYGGRNGSEAPYVPQSSWKAEPAYPASNAMGQAAPGLYQPPGAKKTYITDPVLAPQPPALQQKSGYPSSGPASSTPAFRPEDELEHLTKKMLYDMENPPSDDYFGRCARCGENVVGEGTGCTAMDQVFHVECFTCIKCKDKLRGQPFYAVEKKAYCEPCYIKTLEQCSVCAKPIMERILRATGKAYHPHCFTCVMCHRSLDGIPFTVDAGGNIHCIEDFHKKFAPRCSVCKEPIMPAPGQEETVRIVALDRDFHVQCYRCEDCGGLLSEGDNQGCYPLDGHILCKTCNSARIQALTAKASTDL